MAQNIKYNQLCNIIKEEMMRLNRSGLNLGSMRRPMHKETKKNRITMKESRFRDLIGECFMEVLREGRNGGMGVYADNRYKNDYYDGYVKPRIELCDKDMESGDIGRMSRSYKSLLSLYNSQEFKNDVRLTDFKDEIKSKLEQLVSAIRNRSVNA